MSHSQNIHPKPRWETVTAMLNGPGEGCCVVLKLEDVWRQYFDIAIHYGAEKDAAEFISKLKEAIAGLPDQNTRKED